MKRCPRSASAVPCETSARSFWGELPRTVPLGYRSTASNATRRTAATHVWDKTGQTRDEGRSEAKKSVRAGRRAHIACLRDAAEADLIQTAGVEDPEVADSARLQSIFTRLIGECRLEELDTSMRRATDWSGFRRIAELRHLSNDRSWMHCLHAAHGPVLEPDEYIDALRIRLGFPFAAKNSECPSCGGVLDRRGIHAQS